MGGLSGPEAGSGTGGQGGALERFCRWVKKAMTADAALYFEFLDSGIYCEAKHVKKALRLIAWSDPRSPEWGARCAESLRMEFRGRPGTREALEAGAARVFFKMPSDRREAWRQELARSNPAPGEWGAMLAQALAPAAVAAEAKAIGEATAGPTARASPSRARPRL